MLVQDGQILPLLVLRMFLKYLFIFLDRGTRAWIGLNDLDHLNYFLWIDGSSVTFTKWYLGEPSYLVSNML